MERGFFICLQILPRKDTVLYCLHLFQKPCWQYSQPHDLNQADVFLFDMVQLCMGVIYAKRVLLRCNVVAEYQIQFKFAVPFAGNGRDGIMRLPFRFSKNERRFIRIAPPFCQDFIRQLYEPVAVRTTQTDYGHRPFHNACIHIRKAFKYNTFFHLCQFHGEGIAPALKMVVCQYGTANDRQISIRTDKVMRQEFNEIEHFFKCTAVNFHRDMLPVKRNAVFVIVHIRRILEKPVLPCNADGDNPVVLPCRMVPPAAVAFIFPA